jgi:beta-1,4-mannosyl-glycoprotein beta-1,4-N-acetylglucosaminyltransferase
MEKRNIYDCFIFFNELDILELRLNILDPVVDYFVLCESSYTHSGKSKPFYFEEHKHEERFAPFLHKIIHLKITDSPLQFCVRPPIDSAGSFPYYVDTTCNNYAERIAYDMNSLFYIYKFISETILFNKETELSYGRDFFQKECIRRGLFGCKDEDIIISSDLDEIPNPEILKNIESFFVSTKLYSFRQNSYYYYLNMLQSDDWYGSRMGTYGMLKHYSYNELRKKVNEPIQNGGWHFSFQGGAERVKNKINSYSHQELNTDEIKNGIEDKIARGVDPFGRSDLRQVQIDNSFPQYLRDNIDKYSHMIKS